MAEGLHRAPPQEPITVFRGITIERDDLRKRDLEGVLKGWFGLRPEDPRDRRPGRSAPRQTYLLEP